MKIVTIKLLAGISHNVDIGNMSTVQELVDQLSIRYQIDKKRIRLVHKGKILGNEFSLDFYNIKEKDVIIMIIQKLLAEKYKSPKHLFKKFITKINKLEMLDYDDFMKTYREIHELSEDPILTNYANRNPEMKRTILDALNYADSIEKPLSPSTLHFFAKNQDLCFQQIEGSTEGYRCLTSEYLDQIFDNDSNDCEIYFPFDEDDDILDDNDDDVHNDNDDDVHNDNDDDVHNDNDNNERDNKEEDYFLHTNQMDLDYTQTIGNDINQTNLDYSPSINSNPLPLPNHKAPFKRESSIIFNERDSRINGVNIEGNDYLFMK